MQKRSPLDPKSEITRGTMDARSSVEITVREFTTRWLKRRVDPRACPPPPFFPTLSQVSDRGYFDQIFLSGTYARPLWEMDNLTGRKVPWVTT